MTRRRQLWIAGSAVVALAAIAWFWTLAGDQHPKTTWDSNAYLETAQRDFSWEHFYYPKPVLVPVAYRWLGADPSTIVAAQEWFCLLAWGTLAAALIACLQTTRARVAAGVVAIAFFLDPLRVGYCDTILSESINDSLLALVVAAIVAFARFQDRPRARHALLASGVLVTAMWILTRDTNAIVTLVGAVACLVVWRRSLRGRWLELGGLGALVGLSVFVLWSMSVVPSATGLKFQGGMPEDFGARGTYPLLDVLVDRALPDPELRAYFVDHGLPQVDELDEAGKARYKIFGDPHFEPTRLWIEREERGVWMSYLVRHPIDRVTDQYAHFWSLVGAANENQKGYMPPGWRPSFRRIVTSKVGAIVLVVVGLFALWRTRKHPLAKVALCAVISGWLGSLAAMYGDPAEIPRHCYGSGQQVLLGLALAALLLLETFRRE